MGDVQAVMSRVKNYPEILDPLIQEGLLIDRVSDYWKGEKFAGMPVKYAESLGEDRLIANWMMFKTHTTPVLMIDAGTFLTLDIITPNGFEGGYILPGLGLQNQTLQNGENLKSVAVSLPQKELLSLSELPHTTAHALEAYLVSTSHFIKSLALRWNVESIMINGGDRQLVYEIIKPQLTSLEIKLDPHYLHHALYEWYRRNICL
jgi:type III pantothenate kinase